MDLRTVGKINSSNINNINTLEDVDNKANKDALKDVITSSLTTRSYIDEATLNKYGRYGLNWNEREASTYSLDQQLADAQSNWSKLGNALAQTVVSEIGLGTLIGITDMFDAIGQAISVSDHDYNNPVSRTLEEWQDKFRNEIAPIYSRPGSGFENGTDFGWWMQNLPSVASSLTLLIPTNLAFGAVKGIGKALRAGSKVTSTTRKGSKWAALGERLDKVESINKFRNFAGSSDVVETTKLFAKNGLKAGMMRTMENYQEARQVYDDMYVDVKDYLTNASDEEKQEFISRNANFLSDENVNINDIDSVAKAIARKSANETFKLDYINTVFDIIELYALKNIPFHGFRNVRTNATTRRLNKNAIKYAGQYKSLDELKQLLDKRSLKNKIREGISDWFVGSRLVIGAQLSEGVEEAVNYIAQQEGMNLGHTMLGMEVENNYSNRLNSYLKNGQLWESAFWGVAGGVIFQGVGSQLNRVSTAIDKYNDYKERKANAKTGEEVKKPTWSALFEQPDRKRDEAEMKIRIENEQEYLRKVHAIKNGQNPYDPNYKETEEQGSLTEEEQKPLLEYANTERITNMALNAMDGGRIKQLQAYLESEEVRNAMKDQLGLTDEQAEEIRQNGLRTFEQVQQKYDENVRKINKLSRQISDKVKIPYIPTEYIQLIARENIDKQLQIEELEKQINALELSTSREENDLRANNRIDPNVDYKTQIRLDFITSYLGKLQADKKALQNDKDKMNTVSGQQELARINRNIESVKNSIVNLRPDNSIANLLFAISASSNVKFENGQYVSDNRNVTDDYLNIRKLIDTKDISKLKEIDKRLVDITEADLQELSIIEDNNLRTNVNAQGIRRVSPELFDNYQNLAGLQESLNILRANVVLTPDDLANQVNELHNWMNEARGNAILNAKKTFVNLLDNYTSDQLHQILANRVNGVDEFNGVDNISENDKTTIKNVLDILNLETLNNVQLVEWLDGEIDIENNKRAAERQNSSTSENSISEEENQPLNESPQPGENKPTPPQERQIEPIPPQSTPQAEKVDNSTITLTDNAIPYAKLTPVPNNDSNEYYLDLQTVDGSYNYSNEATKLLNDDDYFIKEEGVSLLDDSNTWRIDSSPVVRYNNGRMEVISKGHIVPNKQSQDNQQLNDRVDDNGNNQSNNEQPSPILPTGVEEQTPNNVQAQNTPGDVIPDSISDKIQDIIAEETDNIFKRELPVLTDEDIETIRTRLINAFGNVDKNGLIVSHINKSLDNMKAEFNQYGGYIPVITAVRNARLLDNNPKDSTILTEFQNAINSIIDAHRLEFGFDNVNGKTYVHVETLLRYCNQITDNQSTANKLFKQLYNYLNSSDKYVIVDGNKDRILKNISSTTITETNTNRPSSINFDGVLDETTPNSPEEKKLFDTIDSIQIGDEIDFEYKNNSIVFSLNGVKIGRIYVPYKHRGNTDHVIQNNDGWLTDIKPTKDGVESDLRDLFISWIENPNNDPNITKLYNTILEFAFTNRNDKANRDRLIKEFINNPEIIKAKQNEFIDASTSPERLLDGIAKLWRYIQIRNNNNLGRLARVDSVNNWFDIRVGDGVKLALTLARQGEGKIKIANITEGARVSVIPDNEKIALDDERLNTPHVALGDRYKTSDGKIDTSKVKLMTTELEVGVGTINHTDKSINTQSMSLDSNLRNGSTGVLIITRNGEHEYIHAYPQRVSSPRISKDGRKITKAIIDHTRNIITRWSETEDPTERENIVRELQIFLSKILPNKDDKTVTPFFKGADGYYNVRISDIYDKGNRDGSYKGTGEWLGFQIVLTKNGKSETYGFKVKYNSTSNHRRTEVKNFALSISKDNQTTDIKDLKEITDTIANLINNECAFNLGHQFIELDNSSAVGDTGIVSKDPKTGKIHIKVGDILDLEYDSYNQFILDNDIVALNLQTTENGYNNFDRNPESGVNRQTITVENVTDSNNLDDNITPVERSNQTPLNDFYTPIIDTKAIDKVIKSRNVNKGLAIAKLLLSNDKNNDKFKELLFKKIVSQVFPKNVIFVDENIGVVATSNPNNVPIPVYDGSNIMMEPGQMAIGREWLDTANSGELGRHGAVRLLVHENLHILLNTPGNEKYIDRIRTIYDEFVAKNDNPKLNKYYLTQFKDYVDADGKLNTIGLEEFLVYSLTDNNLSQKLNEIKSDEEFSDKTKKSLFQEIMEFMLQLFDWKDSNGNYIEAKIKEGSLYEKEFKLLGDIFENSKPKKTTRKKAPKTTNIDNTQLSLDFSQNYKQEKGDDVKSDETEEPINLEENNGFENADLSSLSMNARISDVLPYSKEMLDIRAKAIADGTFMKAPNGKPTNLNERQWLQVRTKAFKEWFGDWEKGLVVNQDKESFYRGQFDEPFIDKNGNLILYGRDDSLYKSAGYKESKGVSVTRDLKSAIEYGEGQLETRINIVMDSSMDESEQNAVIDNGYYLIQFKDSVSNKEIKEAGESKLLGDITVPKGSYIIEHYVQGELIETIGNINNPNASKVVDENGEPLVVYHGSDKEFTEFNLNTNNRGNFTNIIKKGFYFSNKNIASQYASSKAIEDARKLIEYEEMGADFDEVLEAFGFNPKDSESYKRGHDYIMSLDNRTANFTPNLYAVFLNIKNPVLIDLKGNQIDTLNKEQKEKINNSEGSIIFNVDEATARFRGEKVIRGAYTGTDYIAFNSNQIKSATDNTGEFSRDSDDVYSTSIPSVEEFLDRFPIEDQKQIKESIDNGELSLSCK